MKGLMPRRFFAAIEEGEIDQREGILTFGDSKNQCDAAISMGFFLYKYGSMEWRRIWIKINWLK
jgi:hypothetical protein